MHALGGCGARGQKRFSGSNAMILFNPACTLAPIAGWHPSGVMSGKLSVNRFGVGRVQPYLSLGLGLQRAGHDASLLAPENFARFVESRGVRFCPLSGDIQAFLNNHPPGC